MVGHGSILAFDERTDMRALARHLLEFGADESCGKCFPCRIGLQRAASRWSSARGRSTASSLEALLETLELGSLCAHGGGMPAPDPQPDRALPRRAGAGRGRAGPSPMGPTTVPPPGGAARGRPEERRR